MTRIQQDTAKVHLVDSNGQALCAPHEEAVVLNEGAPTVPVSEWSAGFTPAGLGARVCRVCEVEAGTAAKFEPGEKEQGAWKALDA